jgi:hypothetical protein
MSHRCIVFIAILIVGAATNLAVAWGCAIWSTPKYDRDLSSIKSLDAPSQAVAATLKDQDEIRVQAWTSFGYRRQDVGKFVSASGPNPQASYARFEDECTFVECGWPLKCVNGDRIHNKFVKMQYAPPWLTQPSRGSQLMPYRVILWPFVLNSLMFASAVSLVVLGPKTLRRMMRGRENRCKSCGYDLRGAAHERCPECSAESTTAHAYDHSP